MSLVARFTVERENFSLDVDLKVPSRGVLGVVGENGSGKSTALDVIAGLLPCTIGSVVLDDSVLDEATTGVFVQPELRGIATVFQGGGLFPHLSVGQNLAFGLDATVRGDEARHRAVEAALEEAELPRFAARDPATLSGGQRQRVALGRAIVRDPKVFLFDEPLSNLDAKLREEMQIELRQIQRTVGTTTILVTHDQAEAMALSDRIVVMTAQPGRIKQIVPVDQFPQPRRPVELRADPRFGALQLEIWRMLEDEVRTARLQAQA